MALTSLNIASPDCAEEFFAGRAARCVNLHHASSLAGLRIDMLDPAVARFFRAIAGEHILPRLQISAVRLLGCETAVTESGQRTLRMLGQILRLPVYGTLKPLFKSHSNAAGFDPAFTRILVEASALS